MDSDENLPMDIKQILTGLNKTLKEDRKNAYASLASTLTSQKDIPKSIQPHSAQIIKCLSRDIISQDTEVMCPVLTATHLFVKSEQCLGRVPKDDLETLLLAVLKVGKEDHSEDEMKQILFILARQKFPPALILSKIVQILDTLEHFHIQEKTDFCADILEVLVRLHEQTTRNFATHSQRWCRFALPCLVHSLFPVRSKSFILLKYYKSSLIGNVELEKHVVKTIDTALGKPLVSLIDRNLELTIDTWSFLICLAGKALHKGSTINTMLEIIESGFKGSSESRIHSFRAWKHLVDNFALDADVISESKRIRLLMMVLKTNNAKTEAVAQEKFNTWWYFVTKVGTKVSSSFEQILYPLLQLCIGNGNQSSQVASQSPNLALKMCSPSKSKTLIQSRIGSQHLPVFTSLQKLGCQIIGRLVSKFSEGDEPLGIKWTIDPLSNEALPTPATFLKHAPFILMSLEALLKSVGTDIQDSLVLHIWKSLSNHLRVALEKGVKVECREVFGAFLPLFHSLVQSGCFHDQMLMKLYQSSSDFPAKVLSSTLYNVGVGTAVKGCPAQLLSEVLFMPSFMKLSFQEELYIPLFTNTVSAGASNQQGALSFIQAVTRLVDSAAESLASSNLMCKLWSVLAHTLLDNITVTNEVNQGDALEYNFGCLYAVLLLPIKHQLPSKVSQGLNKTMTRTWCDLYHSFARLSALVTTADANACLEEMSVKIIGAWNPEFKDPHNLEFLSAVCLKMLDGADFSALSVARKQSGLTLSPSKWTKRRQRPMANLHSFVHLLAKLQTDCNSFIDQSKEKPFGQKQSSSDGSLVSFVTIMLDVYTRLFAHIPNTLVSHVLIVLSNPLAGLFNGKAKAGGAKIFFASVLSKLERLWFEISNCVTGRYSDQYDSSFLATMSPLLEVTFLHSRRAIKSQTLTLWTSTFSKSIGLIYPDDLRPVLSKVKENTAIILPGWITLEDHVIEETPFSEVSQGESQVPTPVLPGLPSPKPQRGSFLNRDRSPANKSPLSKKSPAKLVSPKDAKSMFSTRRNISAELNMMSDKDFVVISSPTKKRRVLTEHQKEVMKEKRIIPVMYNNLDASQDTNLMARLNAESQQESMSMSCSEAIVIESSESQTCRENQKLFVGNESKEESSSTLGFTVPKQLRHGSRRRSVRIQEMSVEDECSSDKKLTKAPSKKSQRGLSLETDKSQDVKSLDKETAPSTAIDKSSEIGSLQNKKDEVVLSSLGTSIESLTAGTCDSSKTSTEPAAFGMFRTKNVSTIPFDNHALNAKSSNNFGAMSSEMRPKRVSVRTIKNNEVKSSIETLPVSKPTELEPVKPKSPRRVPLQRISEKEPISNDLSKNGVPEMKENNAEITSPKHDSKSELDCTPPRGEWNKPISGLEKWLSKGNNTTPQGRKRRFSDVAEPDELGPIDSPIIPMTLVEDTQSPRKCGRRSTDSASASIAETPTKSDDSPSPMIPSIRKLFADNTAVTGSEQNNATDETPKRTLVKSLMLDSEIKDKESEEVETEAKNDNADGDFENLSQGFVAGLENKGDDTKVDDVSQIESDKMLSSEKNTQKSNSSSSGASEMSESMMMMMMPMPTLASQTKDFGISSARSDSSSGSKSSSSLESDAKEKILSATESEFDPSQATLKDECNPTVSVTKKKLIRETLASTRSRRKIKKKDMSSSNSDDVQDSSRVQNLPEGDKKDEETNQPESIDQPEVNRDDDKKIISSDGVHEVEKECGSQPSPVVGEVTPIIKSPTENVPVQRCSTTKKRRLMAKRLSAKLGLQSEGDIEDMSDTEANALLEKEKSGVQSEKVKRKSARKLDGRLISSMKKRISPTASPPIRNKKHLLRLRTKAVKSLTQSPPVRRRQVLVKNTSVESIDESSMDQPLSLLVEQKKTSAEQDQTKSVCMEIDSKKKVEEVKDLSQEDSDDDNEPLSSLASKKSKDAAKEMESNLQGSEIQTNVCEKTTEVEVGEKDVSSEIVIIDSCQDIMFDVDTVESSVDDEKGSDASKNQENENRPSDMTNTEDDIPPGQVAPCEDIEGSDQSTGSDEVFDNGKDKMNVPEVLESSENPSEELIANLEHKEMDNPECVQKIDKQSDVIMEVDEEKDSELLEEKEKEIEPNPQEGDNLANVPDIEKEASDHVMVVEEPGDSEKEAVEEYVPSNWSPSKSPSCSILRKAVTPSSENKGRRVSFAEPVVSGESPVREKYHAESLPTSPLICNSINLSRPGQQVIRTGSPVVKMGGRGNSYRRRLEIGMKKTHGAQRPRILMSSPSQSPSSQNTFTPIKESQLDSVNPIFPDLVDCKASLDTILPQLTSSLWYRGLCQLMKGRNLHTIGDLSALTEVQVNQMPIRCPKVETVRDTLTNYLNQHGNGNTTQHRSKSIFGGTSLTLDVVETVVTAQTPNTPKSEGATLTQEVTPSTIADEGLKILPRVEQDLSQLSPIKDPTKSTGASAKPQEIMSSSSAISVLPLSSTSSSSTAPSTVATDKPSESKPSSSHPTILNIANKESLSELQGLNTRQLFELHQKLNILSNAVLEEIKDRSLQS